MKRMRGTTLALMVQDPCLTVRLSMSACKCLLIVCLAGRRSGTPSRFDASFYRTHDALSYIPSDVQSLRSQATYSSGLPIFAAGPFSAVGGGIPRGVNGTKRSTYSYASSVISQDAGANSVTDSSSVVGMGTA